MENKAIQKQHTQTAELLLTNGASELDFARFERNLTIQDCIKSQSKSIYVSCNTPSGESEILKNIFKLTQRFLMVNFPETLIDLTASQFSQDIISIRRDWNLNDIVMFFKFIRTRQDIPKLKTYGSKITSIKLIEYSAIYENERCEVKESVFVEDVKKEEGLKVLANLGEELAEKLRIKNEKTRNEKIERAVKTNKYHRENEAKLAELKEKMNKGEITDTELGLMYNNFLIRKY